jgi:hypothetical protein
MLQSTPTKFAAKLEESIPNIVEKLKGVILDQVHLIKTTNTQELAKRDKFIADMEGQFREITEKAAKFDKKRIAMFFLKPYVIGSYFCLRCNLCGILYDEELSNQSSNPTSGKYHLIR